MMSILHRHEQKILQKFAPRLDGERFQSATSIGLCQNFRFMNAVTYLIILQGKAYM